MVADLPEENISDFKPYFETVFGKGAVCNLSIRHYGVICLDEIAG